MGHPSQLMQEHGSTGWVPAGKRRGMQATMGERGRRLEADQGHRQRQQACHHGGLGLLVFVCCMCRHRHLQD